MESGGLCSHFIDASSLVLVEMQWKVGPSMFGVVLVVPGFDGVGMYSGFSFCEERELDGGSIRDWLTALSGNGSDDLDIFQRFSMGSSGFQASVSFS
jgi:hypothetical protein